MKKLYFSFLILLSVCLTEKSFAQIPNASFEDWTSGSPDGWATLNIIDTFVVQITDAHAGNSALKSQVLNVFGVNFSSTVVPGQLFGSGKFACNCRPDALHYWYKFVPAGGESFIGYAAPFQGGSLFATPVGINEYDSVLTYKEGIIDFTNYLTLGNADSVAIGFQLDTTGGRSYTLGTYFIIDDLSFGPASNAAVKDLNGNGSASLEQNIPNPSSESASIIYSISGRYHVMLEIFDMTGRKVKEVLNERQTPGRYKAIVDVSDMPAGNYLYRLSTPESVLTKKLVVVK